jgi:hypothetical protein
MDSPLSGEFILNSPTANTATHAAAHPHRIPSGIKTKSLGIFTSLCIDPNGVEIINQDVGEVIHLLIRRDFATNIPWLAFALILLLVPLGIPFVIALLPFSLLFSPSTVIAFLLLYYLSVFGYTLLKFAEWYFNVGLITSQRVVDVDMYNILSRNIAEAPIPSIKEVNFNQKGVLQSLFNYGDVFIQTEAREQNFEFSRVPHPSAIAEILTELAEGAHE